MSKEQNTEDKDEALHIGSVIARFSNEQIDDLICELDEYARGYDPHEYGLPTYDKHMDNMRNIIKVKLNGL